MNGICTLRTGSGPSASTESARTLTLDFQPLELRNSPCCHEPVWGACHSPKGPRSPLHGAGTAEGLGEWQASSTEGSGCRGGLGPPALRESRQQLRHRVSPSQAPWKPGPRAQRENIWI